LNLRGLEVMSDRTVASDSEIQSHPIYTDFFRRVGFGWLMSCLILPDRHELVVLSVPRAKAKGPFTSEEMCKLGLLGRHVEQAFRISLRLSSIDTMEKVLGQALDAVDAGVHALSADGRLLFSNRSGQSQFDHYFENSNGYLTARAAGVQDKLSRYFAQALEAISEGKAPMPYLLAGTAGSQLALWASPVADAARSGFGWGSAAAILVLALPFVRDRRVDPAVLRDFLNLTTSEARLASLIGCGMPIEQVAEQLGITVGTARNVVKKIFRKAGVNRQVELALKISNLPRIAFD
jgi:DNA-binding CsgD family transcriptional regulator